MKDKWTTESCLQRGQNKNGHTPVGLLYTYDSNQWNRPAKAPSTRAIFNYNNIELETSTEGNDNYVFSGDEYPTKSVSISVPTSPKPDAEMSINPGRKSEPNTPIQFPEHQGQLSQSSTIDSRLSDTQEGSEKTDLTAGSTVKLVELPGTTTFGIKFHSCLSSLERGLSCVSLAASFGNVSRLPSMAAQHGGAAFLVAYVILIVLVGAPLVFLELGVGQIVQQGVTRTWRAVPLFRGVAYIKLVINMILCIYYPLYIGLSLFYLTWLAKGQVPFVDCAFAKISNNGYIVDGIPGEQCLSKTFLESPLNDSMWFGIYTAFIALVWLIITICSFRRIKAYMRSMNCFFIPILMCSIALLVKGIEVQDKSFLKNIDWNILQNADVWYYATIQLFFSTHLGFGNVVTCAGKVYNKADPFWAALAYIIVNLIFGVFSVSTCYLLMGESLHSPISSNITTELYFFNTIYDHAVAYKSTSFAWTIVAYIAIGLSGFVSVLASVFTILKAVRVETRSNWIWWHTAAFSSIIFFALGIFCLLVPNFGAVHVLDHYVVGNLLLLCTILEVSAFVYIYGCSNLYLDFEFILGSTLNVIWKILWWLSPIILLAVSIWALATLRLTGVFVEVEDELWMYVSGWSIVLLCLVIIIVIAVYEVYIQVDYNLMEKISSSLKASRKWGPVDPMIRHGWIQWRSTAGTTGDRDFTLKRRGTRDYTHSVKNRRNAPGNSSTKYNSTLNTNDSNDQNIKRHTLEVISITDTLERQTNPRVLEKRLSNNNGNHHVLNPLGVPSMYGDTTTNDSNSEGYGTIRNGPYVIANGEFDHVCWRKAHEEATEL